MGPGSERAVGTRGRVTSLSKSLLPPISVGGKGGFSETGESEEELEIQGKAQMPFCFCLFAFPLPAYASHPLCYRELGAGREQPSCRNGEAERNGE